MPLSRQWLHLAPYLADLCAGPPAPGDWLLSHLPGRGWAGLCARSSPKGVISRHVFEPAFLLFIWWGCF